MDQINYFAVLAAAASTFVLGGLWWSPLLFQRAWMRANGFTEEKLKEGSMAKIFGVSFVLTVVMAFNLAMFLAGPDTTVAWGVTAGVLAGGGWVALLRASTTTASTVSMSNSGRPNKVSPDDIARARASQRPAAALPLSGWGVQTPPVTSSTSKPLARTQ